MQRYGISLALFGSLMVAAVEAGELDGKWTIVGVERAGAAVANLVGGQRIIAGNSYKIVPKTGDTVEGTLSSDAAAKTVDMTAASGQFKGQTLKGIYRLEGNRLTICFAPAGKERPSDFASTAANGATVAVHTRAN